MIIHKITAWISTLVARVKHSSTTRHILLVYIGDVFAKGLAALTSIILIRFFTNADYAGYTAFYSVAILFYSLIGTGINLSMVRYAVEYQETTGEKAYVINLLALMVEFACFLVLAGLVLVFPRPTTVLVLGTDAYSSLVGLSVFLGLGMLMFETGRSYMLAEEKFPVFVGFAVLKNLSILIGALLLIRFETLKLGVFSRLLLGLQLLNGLFVLLYGFRGVFSKLKPGWWEKLKQLFGEFAAASGWLVAYGVVIAILTRLDVMMLSRFADEDALAQYGVAFQFYSFAILILASIGSVLKPKFAKKEMQMAANQRKFLLQWLRSTVLLGIPVLLVILFAKPLYVLVVGVRYTYSFTIFRILLVGVWLSLMFSPLVQILLSRKDFKFLFLASLGALAAGVVVNYVGVQLWGPVGPAVSVIVSNNLVLQCLILWRVLHGLPRSGSSSSA